jgi:acetoin utilization deacetylase AcuC-like enzyme
MTLFYSEPCFLRHQTGAHPENPQRLEGIEERLQKAGLRAACTRPVWGPLSRERLLRVHDPLYVDWVRSVAAGGGGALEPDTVAGPASYDVAVLTELVLRMAEVYAGGRVVSILEGGYNPPVLADCVAAHLATMVQQTSGQQSAS